MSTSASKYANLIHHERPVSPNHKPMSRKARAAQFAPYAALVGHHDIIVANENDFLTQDDPTHLVILDDNPNPQN